MPPKLNRFALGLLIGSSIAFAISAVIDDQIHDAIKNEWTTLLIVISTILAAFIALSGPQKQIEQQYLIERERHQAKQIAARALLPLVASDIHRICSEAIQITFLEEEFFKNTSNKFPTLEKLKISEETIKKIGLCLETGAPNEKAILQLTLAQYQICFARTDRWFDQTVMRNHKNRCVNMAYDWAILRGFSNQLYSLGRHNKEDLNDYLDMASITFFDTPITSENPKWEQIGKVETLLSEGFVA